MNINLTLIGQTISFALFVLFCMKFVWPALISVMEEREKKIADGLDAADRADKDLELAQKKATQQLREAKVEAAAIIEQANKRANQIVEASKEDARKEGEKILAQAQAEIEQQRIKARDALRAEIAAIAVAGAEKILETSVDADKHGDMLNKLVAEL